MYALKDIVYAIGCRLDSSADGLPTSYTLAHERSWLYFENAMSVHTELRYRQQRSGDLTSHGAALVPFHPLQST